MRSRHNSSRISAPCRLEWRPSIWLMAALALLGLLAPLSIALSDIPLVLAVPGGAAAALWALVQLLRERRRQHREVVIAAFPSPLRVDGMVVEQMQLECRGPLTVLAWSGTLGRGHLLFWPDTLSRAQRRELRLALDARRVSQLPAQVAP